MLSVPWHGGIVCGVMLGCALLLVLSISHDPDMMTFCVPWCVEPYIHYYNVGQKALQELVPPSIRKYGGPPA